MGRDFFVFWDAVVGTRQQGKTVETAQESEYTETTKHSLKGVHDGQKEAAERGKSAFEGRGTLHWEKVSPSYRRAAERRANFTRRMGQGVAKTHHAGALLYGYRAVPLKKASVYAK